MRSWNTYRGGRRRRNEPTTSREVSIADARKIIRAVRFAGLVDLPINTHVTVNFSETVQDGNIPGIIAKTLKALRQWLRRKGYNGATTTHMWVREKPGARHSHVHFLLHLPPTLAREVGNRRFAMFLPREAEIDARTISDSAQPYSGTPVLIVRNPDSPEAWAKYIIKGIGEEYAAELSVRPSSEGTIVGKRVGVAENIGHEEWIRWTLEGRAFGRDFALSKWRERAAMGKSRLKSPVV